MLGSLGRRATAVCRCRILSSTSPASARPLDKSTRARTSSGTNSNCWRRTDDAGAQMFGVLVAPQALHGGAVRNVGVVVVAVGFQRLFGEIRGFFVFALGEQRPAKDVPGTVAIMLALDGAASHQLGFVKLLLSVKKT